MHKLKNKKCLTALSWLLVIVAMITIFSFSSRNGTESSGESNDIIIWIKNTFGINFTTDFIIRKGAHLLEYTGLSYLISMALYLSFNKNLWIYSILLTSAYAVTDEFHQFFVIGRSCQISDWAIDSLGGAIGIVIFSAIIMLFININKKRKQFLDS